MEGREKKDESMLVPSSKERFKDALVEGTRRKKVTREKREEKTKKNKKKERECYSDEGSHEKTELFKQAQAARAVAVLFDFFSFL
mmetsp:Transcript_12545/g.31865  ORF Transcript_12545/g.31865 Transcript_12545/m.31865 type:complete len:85 (+) Transcript_12545:467-721(+)